jgi:hypothetical protein
MVAFAMTKEDSAAIVLSSLTTAEAVARFHLFLKLYGITELDEIARFGDKCDMAIAAAVQISKENAELAEEGL